MVTNTEIHFMPVDECHTHALPRDTMHLRIVGQVCFYRRLFCDAVKPQGCISWLVWPLRGINKTAWGAKLILTAGLVHHSGCASLGHLLMAQHCHFCLGVCLTVIKLCSKEVVILYKVKVFQHWDFLNSNCKIRNTDYI